MKTLVFDMDGTIANLYGVNNWLNDLRNENPRPYVEAEPMWNMEVLAMTLQALKTCGFRIIVCSWLAKESTTEYDMAVRQAKKDWLDRFAFPYDEIHLVQYGTTKANTVRHHNCEQTLIDDNKKVRDGWHLGRTIDPTNEDLLKVLLDLYRMECYNR